ncbi:hypothetical protein VTO42DRAFT_2324 [Malbranchea cinnamomea]
MGVIATAKVVTWSEGTLRLKHVQPGNTEWVTIVEGVNATGWSLPPLIILTGKRHQASWYENRLPETWRIETSEPGWINEKLGLIWLKEVFDKGTPARTMGQYGLLILDGHGSHNGPEFDQFCLENSIIPLYMPGHSSHLLQPLDVGCYSPLKQVYKKEVEKQMRLGFNHIDKDEFLTIYSSIRPAVLSEKNIQSGFRAPGIAPYDPEQVLAQLNTYAYTHSSRDFSWLSGLLGYSHSSQCTATGATE